MKYPFEATIEEILNNPEPFVDSVFASLESDFLILPKGKGFVEYAVFENGYELLKAITHNFSEFSATDIYEAVVHNPIILIVLRTMMGFTPPEWAYLASHRTQTNVSQGYVRSLDRKIRMSPESPIHLTKMSSQRLMALIETACQILTEGAPTVAPDQLHRLDKADTRDGADGIQHAANMGVPYAILLYERLLGRPFAAHRDSVSDLIGERLEIEIERLLTRYHVSFRKTKRAERLAGFDQVPDFIIPSEFNPQVVIEAKITEDDGTARDKVTRIQHLAELSAASDSKFEVIACIGGRGFGVRREDMKKLMIATRGKVFTTSTLERMIEFTKLSKFVSL